MTHGVPAGLEGQIESPNSLELLWEKYKRFAYGILVAVLAAIGLTELIAYLDRKATDERWSKFVVSAGLDLRYVDLPEFDANRAQNYFNEVQFALLADLSKDVAAVDLAVLERELAAVEGDKVLDPLVLWIRGVRAAVEHDFDTARSTLQRLQQEFPAHYLTVETGYPVQWRPEVEKEDDEKETKRRREKAELEPPVAGSAVGMMLARIDAEQAFREANARFFDAPEPDSTELVVMTLKDDDGRFDGTIKIRLYASRAPKHVEAFLKAVRDEKFFDGLRIHSVARTGTDAQMLRMMDESMRPSEFKFGLPVTREEDDRTKWTNASGTVAEEHVVDWEESGVSHFPGMLAAEQGTMGKSQIERLVINGNDMAASQDGTRVVFGRVVEGLDLVRQIINEIDFRSENDNRFGRGIPSDSVRIESVTIE